jgi:hypothetical protein
MLVKFHPCPVAGMAPHCDTMDGPVVKAARLALDTGNVNLALPWVQEQAEEELMAAFRRTLESRAKADGHAKAVIDLWFYETAVRLHRQGEGAPYTGLKPAGLDEGSVIPMADRAIEEGDAGQLIGFVTDAVKEELGSRFADATSKKGFDPDDVGAAREYVHAMLGFVLYAHQLYEFVKGARGESHDERRREIISKASRLGHYHGSEKEIEE